MKGLKLSIRSRLVFILICWIIVLSCFGLYTRVKMNELSIITQQLNSGPLKVSNSAKKALVNVLKIERGIKDLLLIKGGEEVAMKLVNSETYHQEVLDNLQIIENYTIIDEIGSLEAETRDLFLQWRRLHQEMINLTSNNGSTEALRLAQTKSIEMVTLLEENLVRMDSLAVDKAASMATASMDIEVHLRDTMIYFLIGIVLFFTILFIIIIRGIVGPITTLTTAINKSTLTGKLTEVALPEGDEISDIAGYYNSLVKKLQYQFWIKDNQNFLNQELSRLISIEDMTQKSINFLARSLSAGKGAFYLYDKEDNELVLSAAYAFTEKEGIKKIRLGEGIVGQVALERIPILLTNIKNEEAFVASGIFKQHPASIYALPIVFENELYGVIELAFLEEFKGIKEEFIVEASKIISINLFSTIQGEKIKMLLAKAEASEIELRIKANELQITNSILEEQQSLLQQQTEELQQTNAELEEQQQLLQQQSEELQSTNSQLEEQQQLLENQSSLLNNKNQELEKSRIELMSYSKELEQASKYKSEFLANMSHELRTPLNSIILLSKLLMNNMAQVGDEPAMEKLEVIYNSGNELLRLINEILDLSKIEAGKMDLTITEFHTQELLKEIFRLFKGLAEEKGIIFTVEDSVDSTFIGDYNKISQILRNFISNALKFTEEGSVTVSASLDCNRQLVLSVVDTGIGISAENLNIIFEEFQQGDGSISRRFGGTGLGLSISKQLADLMEAEISVNSKIGEGSRFELRLNHTTPINNNFQKDMLTEVAAAAGEHIDMYLTSKTNKTYSLRLDEKKVLIVDDDARNIFVLASALESYGAEIVEAENGEAALRLLEEQAIDLILIDIMMPVMDGFKTIEAIRRMEKVKHLPIIAITAKSLKGDRDKCIAAGANDYISKPVDYDTLIHLVKAWIDKMRLNSGEVFTATEL